ncbi:MAG: putative porin [Cyclobacteriaceae bacterium]
MRKSLVLLFFLYTLGSYAQLLDDSTELVYGPKTTRFILESGILNNQLEYSYVDTSLHRFDQRSFYDRNRRRYQNLGNFGTAVFPVFHTPQKDIGRSSGFNAFAPYADPEGIKFYDTKSPFIDLLVYLGGGNKNLVNVGYSRNVREGWNIGFDLKKITADKLIARDAIGDRQTENTNFDFYTHYKNNKVPYQFVFYVSKLSHKVIETGGTRFGEDSLLSELFQKNTALLRLEDAQSIRKETSWHYYHDYQIADQFQLYHSVDFYNEENTFKDATDGAGSDYDSYSDAYNGVFLIDPDSTSERSSLSSTTNELGIKGDLSTVFYRAYVKLRSVKFNYFLLDPFNKVTEKYIGGYARFKWKEKFAVTADGEAMDGGFYKFGGSLSSELVNVRYESSRYNVPFIYQAYFGNHFEWNNDFSPVFVNSLNGSLRLHYKAFTFIPKATFSTYTDFVYFNELQLPEQASSGIAVGSLGGEINLSIKGNKKDEGFYIENEVVASSVTGGSSDAMRIPELFYNGRYYWSGLLFDDKVPIQIGLDTHARSSYFANNYQPATQQFYIQNEFETTGYFKADLFLNMRLDKFFLGIKWAHLNQLRGDGYFTTPYYPGHAKGIDLIIQWRFFD